MCMWFLAWDTYMTQTSFCGLWLRAGIFFLPLVSFSFCDVKHFDNPGKSTGQWMEQKKVNLNGFKANGKHLLEDRIMSSVVIVEQAAALKGFTWIKMENIWRHTPSPHAVTRNNLIQRYMFTSTCKVQTDKV